HRWRKSNSLSVAGSRFRNAATVPHIGPLTPGLENVPLCGWRMISAMFFEDIPDILNLVPRPPSLPSCAIIPPPLTLPVSDQHEARRHAADVGEVCDAGHGLRDA